MAEQQKSFKRQTLNIDNREKLSATGILKVDSFSDELITAQTDLGQLNIKGKNLHIENLSADTGDMYVTGHVIAISYSESATVNTVFGRLFK